MDNEAKPERLFSDADTDTWNSCQTINVHGFLISYYYSYIIYEYESSQKIEPCGAPAK